MQAADDAQGHRAFQAVGSAEGNGPVAHLHRFGVSEGRLRWQSACVEANQGEVGHRIRAHHTPIQLVTIRQRDAHGFHPIHHMGIGQHQAIGIDHHAGTLPSLALLTNRRIAEQIAQQRVDQGRIKWLPLHCAFGVDPHDRWGDLFDGIGHKAVLQRHCRLNADQQHQPDAQRSAPSFQHQRRVVL